MNPTPFLCLCLGVAPVALAPLGAQATDHNPLAVLDQPPPSERNAGDDPLAVLDRTPADAADGPADPNALDALDPEAAAAARHQALLKPPPEVRTIEAARSLYQAGHFARAEIMVKVLLREDTLDRAALMLRADLELARYDGAGAEISLRRALDAQEPRAQVEVKLARALNLQRKYRRVLTELKPDRLDDPAQRARLLAQQARARVGLGHTAEAQLLLDEAMAIGPAVAAPLIGRAVLALRGGFPDQARELVDRALRHEPDNTDAWLLLGQIARQRGNRHAAEVAFGEAIERAPSKWMAAYWRAITRAELGKLAAAEQDIALAGRQFPDFAGLAYARGRLALAAGQPARGAAQLERYLAGMPADPDALFHAALAANQLRNREQALGYLDRLEGVEGKSVRQLWLRARTLIAAGDYAAAARVLNAAGPEAPVELILAREVALRKLGQTADALALIQEARAVRPQARALEVAEAKLRFAEGDLAQAEKIADSLLLRDPDDPDALLILSEAALRRGEATVAMAHRLQEVATDADTEIRLPTLRAEILAAKGLPGEACAALIDALRIDPTSGGVLARLQKLDCASVDEDLVQRAFHELIAEDANAARALPGLLALTRDPDDADSGMLRLEVALQAAPEDIELRSALVDALLRLRRTDAARAVVEAVPNDQASHPLLLRALGVVALTQGQDGVALAAFKDLAAAQPGSAEAAYLLAEAQARSGDAEAARYHLLEGWTRNARHPLAPAVVARVFGADTDSGARRRLIADLQRQAPDSPLIEPLQARTLLDAGYPGEAAEIYAAMHTRDPDNPRLFLKWMLALAASGQREPVIELAEPWMGDHSRDAGVALALADANAELGRTPEAARWYVRVVELQPDNLFALNDLAVLLTESDPAAAVQLAMRAYELAPTEPQVMDTLGAALLAAGQTARARTLLTEAYGYRGSDPGIGLNLAWALAADGDADAARRVLAPLLDEDFPRQAQARALMRRLSTR